MSRAAGLFRSDGTPLAVGERVADSGEASLYRLRDDAQSLLKLYHDMDTPLIAKLEEMIDAAPEDPSLLNGHKNFAWPTSLAQNTAGLPVGVLVPDVAGAQSLTRLCNPKLRARRAAHMNFHFLHAVGANIAFMVSFLHNQGIIIGDIKPDNILINDSALVTFIDCDSMAFTGPESGHHHLCRVGSEGFTAPEWVGRRFDREQRNETSDRFGLAVLLYQLLTGAHPWTGEWMGGGEPPNRDLLIKSGDWPYRPGSRLRPNPSMVSLETLAPGLRNLFRQCFIAGHRDPVARPTASDWYAGLCEALADLMPCNADGAHHHDEGFTDCPWCTRRAAGLPEMFPAPATPADPFAPLVLAFERALARGDFELACDLWQNNPPLQKRQALKEYGKTLFSGLPQNQADPHKAPLKLSHDDDLSPISIPEKSTALTAPKTEAVANTLPEGIRFRIVPGWPNLRPAKLIFDAARRTKLPAFALYADKSATSPVLEIQPQPISKRLEFTFPEVGGKTNYQLHITE